MKVTICERIKTLRKKHGYSQEKLAEMLNMGQNTYSDLESGKRKLDIERLFQIAQFYKISINRLLEDPPPLDT
jgi:transcriptional regulator with XRE-family HTH domain